MKRSLASIQAFQNFFLSVLILFSFPKMLNAQNIALNKGYTLSVAPNYQPTAPDPDRRLLTDGNYTKGAFWTKKTTLGWVRRQVTITIDLGSIQPVCGIAVHTCRNAGVGIDFPSNIFVFTSADNIHYSYKGDAAENVDSVSGSYKVERLCLANINARARYIAVTIVPSGAFIFADEVEVYGGKVKKTAQQDPIPVARLGEAVDSLKVIEFNKRTLQRNITFLENLEKFKDRKSQKVFAESKKKLKNIRSGGDMDLIRTMIGRTNALNLSQGSEKSFIVERINIWDSLGKYSAPVHMADTIRYDLYIPVSGVQYGGFAITNLSADPNGFSLNISEIDRKINQAEIFSVPFVPSLNFTEVADPLVPVVPDLNMQQGISSVFMVKVSGLKSGVDQIVINIKKGDEQAVVIINTTIISLPENPDAHLNAIVWAYLNFPMIKDRPREAGNDLFDHHINTVDISPATLPRMGVAGDDDRLIEYLKSLKGIKNFLLLPNYAEQSNRDGYKGGIFMSDEWKSKFKVWYRNIVSVIRNHGFPNAEVYFYPYDEIHEAHNISDFQKLILWARKAIPDIRFYATLGNKSAIDTLLPLLDIAQIHTDYKGIYELPRHTGKVWMYSVKSAARSLSAYTYYRLMAWQAFSNGFEGIGFWNYADEGRDKVLNLVSDPFNNPAASFSVIYDGPGKEIISSRRWEAFRLGIEDYDIITAYSRKFGRANAKAMVEQVLSDTNNRSKADEVRNLMIKSLQ